MTIFTKEDGPRLLREGLAMVKLPNPVYLERQETPFEVETNEGILSARGGDYLAHDPLSGHVWPVSAAYVEQHYVPAGEQRDLTVTG